MKYLTILFFLAIMSFPTLCQTRKNDPTRENKELIEKAQVVFSHLLRDEAKAKKLIEDIDTFAYWRPFSFAVCLDLSRQLLVWGYSPNEIDDILRSSGDAATSITIATSYDLSLSQVVLTIGKLGKAQSEDVYGHLESLEEYGLPIYEMLLTVLNQGRGKFTKLSRHDLKKMALEDRLRAEAVMKLSLQLFKKNFDGLAEKVMKSR